MRVCIYIYIYCSYLLCIPTMPSVVLQYQADTSNSTTQVITKGSSNIFNIFTRVRTQRVF